MYSWRVLIIWGIDGFAMPGKKLIISAYASRYLAIIQENVIELRGKISQKDFARKTGLSYTTIQRMESGKNFEIVSLLKIGEAFNIDAYDLFLTKEEQFQLKEHDRRFREFLAKDTAKIVMEMIEQENKK